MKTTVKIYGNENYTTFNCYNILFENKPNKTVLSSDSEYLYIIDTYKNIEVCRKIEQNIDGESALYSLEYNDNKLMVTEHALKMLLGPSEMKVFKKDKKIKFYDSYLLYMKKYSPN